MKRDGQSIDHPVVFIVSLVMQAVMLLGVMPLLIWICTSIFATPAYMKWVLDTEHAWNEAVFAFQFGLGDDRSFALENAIELTARIMPSMRHMDAPPAPRAPRGHQDSDMASSLNEQFASWMEEAFVPSQRYYLPLLMVRGLVLAGLVLTFILPFLAGTYRGQAERRRLLSKGALLKPHRFMIYKTLLLLVTSLLFAYPAYPVPIPAFLFLPLAVIVIHEFGRKTCSSMMEL